VDLREGVKPLSGLRKEGVGGKIHQKILELQASKVELTLRI
jgi:hypothetical protein